MKYITRDKYFIEEFFDVAKDILKKYYNVNDCKINGIKYTSGLITIVVVGAAYGGGWENKEWEIRIPGFDYGTGFDSGYNELNRFLQCKIRENNLKSIGI